MKMLKQAAPARRHPAKRPGFEVVRTEIPAPPRAPIVEVAHDGRLLGLILRASFSADGIQFLTPPEFSQQLGYMRHPTGKIIAPHVHNAVTRDVTLTQEVLFVRHGRVRVDFYADDRSYLRSYVLATGDVILLAQGGHGFEMLEPTEMIEVKQGPHVGALDKTRFEAAEPADLRIVE